MIPFTPSIILRVEGAYLTMLRVTFNNAWEIIQEARDQSVSDMCKASTLPAF